MRFAGVAPLQIAIAGQIRLTPHLQAPLQPAQQGSVLVLVEVVARMFLQQRQHVLQRLFRIGTHVEADLGGRMAMPSMFPDRLCDAAQFDQLGRNLGGPEHEVRHAGIDCRLRHAGLLGIGGRLDEGDAALLLDARQAGGAVRTHARQDHTDGFLLMRHGQRAEEDVDRLRIARCAVQFVQDQVAVFHFQAARWRNDVDLVGQDRHRMVHLHDRQAGGTLQDAVCVALLIDRQVEDDDQRDARGRGQLLEQRGECRKAAGRRPDTDDRKRKPGLCVSIGSWLVRFLRVHDRDKLSQSRQDRIM